MAISYFGAKTSQLYYNDREGLAIKTSSEELTDEIRASFEEILNENDWMDEGNFLTFMKTHYFPAKDVVSYPKYKYILLKVSNTHSW